MRAKSRTIECEPARVADVQAGSPAERAGLRAGDSILTIDGGRPRDVIDLYMALADGGEHLVDIEREGTAERSSLALSLGPEAPGIEMSEQIFDGVRTCENTCMFCFVDQLPEGLRKSVYIKDDDYRLSFLCGNFITLTNMTRADVKRVVRQRLSPLYVSLHSTDHSIRTRMFGNPEADSALKALKELLRAGIEVHIQIVLVRGVNDEERLDATLQDLSRHYRRVASIGVVPVGLSSGGRRTLPDRFGFDAESSARVIEQVAWWSGRFEGCGPYAADEFFFMAGEEPPGAAYYGSFDQTENGIGLARLFRDSFLEAVGSTPLGPGCAEGVALVTTPAGAWALDPLGIEAAGARILVCENTLFGSRVNVCGLLSGREVERVLGGADGVKVALVPDVMLDHLERFIDGVTLAQVAERTGVPLVKVPATGEGLLEAIVGTGEKGGRL